MVLPENYGDYYWPGQFEECLANKLDIHDQAQLEAAERDYSSRRSFELAADPTLVEQSFDMDHLRAIHGHLFQDVYEWAGHDRVVDLRNTGLHDTPETVFTSPEQLDTIGSVMFESFAHPTELAGMTRHGQVDELARQMTGVNMHHPFFEGNGRTTRAYFDQVTQAAGLRVDWAQFADRNNDIMAEAAHLNQQPLREALAGALRDAPHVAPAPQAQAGQADTAPEVQRERPSLFKDRGFDPLGGQSPSKGTGASRPPGQQAHRQQRPQQGPGEGRAR